MAYEITIELYFSAAHSLKRYRGKCENIHGHNWKVHAAISSDGLDGTGLVFDFREAKKILKGVLALLDHKQLDDIQFFKKINPTSELIAKFIFNRYKSRLKDPRLNLKSVTVWETPTSSATFSEG